MAQAHTHCQACEARSQAVVDAARARVQAEEHMLLDDARYTHGKVSRDALVAADVTVAQAKREHEAQQWPQALHHVWQDGQMVRMCDACYWENAAQEVAV